MKSVKCWNCGYVIEKPRQNDRKACGKCGSPHWKAPSLCRRLQWAWSAFWWKPSYKPRRHNGKCNIAVDEIITDKNGYVVG